MCKFQAINSLNFSAWSKCYTHSSIKQIVWKEWEEEREKETRVCIFVRQHFGTSFMHLLSPAVAINRRYFLVIIIFGQKSDGANEQKKSWTHKVFIEFRSPKKKKLAHIFCKIFFEKSNRHKTRKTQTFPAKTKTSSFQCSSFSCKVRFLSCKVVKLLEMCIRSCHKYKSKLHNMTTLVGQQQKNQFEQTIDKHFGRMAMATATQILHYVLYIYGPLQKWKQF